jgi:hypothetical protein
MSGTSAKIMGFRAELTCAETVIFIDVAKSAAKLKYSVFID